MNEWQYRVDLVPFDISNLSDLETHLGFFGNAGWEIVSLSVFLSPNAIQTHCALVFVKREGSFSAARVI